MDKNLTDEFLMNRMEALEDRETELIRDGSGDNAESQEIRSEHIAIFNELSRRGYVWSARVGEWRKVENLDG